MNVLCDFHHTDLFRSFRSLFEKRLGLKVFRPVGLDWWDRGYFYHPESDYGRGCLTQASFHRGHLRDYDLSGPSHYPHGKDWREWSWITLEAASRKIDLVVSSHPANEDAFARFRREARPSARLIRYIGNEEEYPSPRSENLLCSNLKSFLLSKKKYHAIFFHPEIDTTVYNWTDPPRWDKPVVRTFLNYIYHGAPQSDKALYLSHRAALAGRAYFFTHGLGTPPPGVELDLDTPLWARLKLQYGDSFVMPDLLRSDGEPESHEEIGRLMKSTNLAWHVKTSDGYGYALHQLYACGRPVICHRKNYQGKTGGLLLKDKKTCVMIDGRPAEDLKKILHYLRPSENERMSRNAREVFQRVVDYSSEAEAVRRFLERLR